MIDRAHPLPVVRQCQLLQLARSTAYYQPMPGSEPTLALMRRIDELHLQYPFAGARMLRDLLRHEGHAIGRRQVATLMRRMGIEALYRKPHLSRRHPAHTIYPYLLRDLTICRPNHVWAADISAPCRRGWRKTNHAGWLLTGSWNAAPLGKETERKGAAKLRHVPTAGCHKQSSLNSTGRGPFSTSRATTVSMVRQRNVRRKPLYLEQPTLNDGMAWGDCGAIRLVLMLPTEGCATHIRRWDVL
jgi:putative transposase